MKSATEVFSYLERKGNEAMQILRAQAFTPNDLKQLKQWGITETAELVGRTSQHIRQQEKIGVLPLAETAKKRRSYTLEQINHLRDHFGTRRRRAGLGRSE